MPGRVRSPRIIAAAPPRSRTADVTVTTVGRRQVMTTGVPSGSVDSFRITLLSTRTQPCDTL